MICVLILLLRTNNSQLKKKLCIIFIHGNFLMYIHCNFYWFIGRNKYMTRTSMTYNFNIQTWEVPIHYNLNKICVNRHIFLNKPLTFSPIDFKILPNSNKLVANRGWLNWKSIFCIFTIFNFFSQSGTVRLTSKYHQIIVNNWKLSLANWQLFFV